LAGQRLTANNISTKRPGTGISPMHWDQLLGQAAKSNYATDDLIE
jgi:sialic acid synthase SpsE